MKRNAIGLVHFAGGVQALDRWCHRAAVVRRARDRCLRLVDVLELSDEGCAGPHEVQRLAVIAARSHAAVLVTHGVRTDLAQELAEVLGLVHVPALEAPVVPS